MELTEIIVHSLQIFIVSTLTVIIMSYLVYRLKKRNRKTYYDAMKKQNDVKTNW